MSEATTLRRGIFTAGALLATIALLTAASMVWTRIDDAVGASAKSHICADFTDAVGLYAGNAVTVLGVVVGSIDSIEQQRDHVTVRISLDRDISLPAAVNAVTTSSSIVTDRRIELTPPYDTGATVDISRCIPIDRTRTPHSTSDLYRSLTNLVGSVSADNQLGSLIDGASAQLSGRGDELHQLIEKSAALVGDPNLRAQQLSTLTAALTSVSTAMTQSQPAISEVLGTAPEFLRTLHDMSPGMTQIFSESETVVPVAGRIIGKYGDRGSQLLDQVTSILHYLHPLTPLVRGILQLFPTTAELLGIYAPSAQTPNPSGTTTTLSLTQACNQNGLTCAADSTATSAQFPLLPFAVTMPSGGHR